MSTGGPVLIPPQSTPIMDSGGLFSRVWFLFLNSLVSAVNRGGTGGSVVRSLAYKSAPQSVAGGGAAVALVFDKNINNIGLIHSETINNTRFTAPSDGVYHAMCELRFDATIPLVQVFIKINGVTPAVAIAQNVQEPPPLNIVTLIVSQVIDLNKGDYIEFIAAQTHVGALNTVETNTWGQLVRLGAL